MCVLVCLMTQNPPQKKTHRLSFHSQIRTLSFPPSSNGRTAKQNHLLCVWDWNLQPPTESLELQHHRTVATNLTKSKRYKNLYRDTPVLAQLWCAHVHRCHVLSNTSSLHSSDDDVTLCHPTQLCTQYSITSTCLIHFLASPSPATSEKLM